MTRQPLPIVQWIRADSVPTLAHELLTGADATPRRERTRCGCRVPQRRGARVRRGQGQVTCDRCLHFRAVEEGRAKGWRPAPAGAARITAQVVQQAREAFTRAGGHIQKIGAR